MSTRQAYAVVLVVAALTTAIATPLFRRVAVRIGAVVAPDERRVHTRPTPLLGGVAMLVGFLVGMFVAWRLDALSQIFSGTTEPLGIVVAASLMLIIGTVDDLKEVSAPAKLAGTVLCASVLVYSGVSLIYFRVPFEGAVVLGTDWAFLLSVIWVIGMTTAINLIDGLDGLAAGIVAIAAGSYFLYTMLLTRDSLLSDASVAPLIAVLVLGMCVGFLPYNFHPAKIFMGDGGALTLGLLMAAATMVVGGRIGSQVSFSGQTYFFFAPLLIPLFILGVPILDTAFSIVRRAARRSSPAHADKEHIHHRLMRLGHGQRRSVLILWGWTLLLSVLVLYPAYAQRQGEFFVPIGIVALGLALYTVLHPSARESRRNGGVRRDERPSPSAGAAHEPTPAATKPVDSRRADTADVAHVEEAAEQAGAGADAAVEAAAEDPARDAVDIPNGDRRALLPSGAVVTPEQALAALDSTHESLGTVVPRQISDT